MDLTHGLTLSKAVKSRSTPLRKYLEALFPITRPLMREYAARVGDLIVDSHGAAASTMGTATDLMIHFLLDPEDVTVSARRLYPFNTSYVATVDGLAQTAGEAARAGTTSDEIFARAVWGLALCVQSFRAGPGAVPLPPELSLGGVFDRDQFMQHASLDEVQELLELKRLSEERLLPHLQKPFHIGPEFDLSKPNEDQQIAAEADFICDGLLLDIKTQLGTRDPETGGRRDSLPSAHLYQLLAYALLDYSDAYGIDRIGIYSARYGALVDWSLEYVVLMTTGTTMDFKAARQELWDMFHERS